MQKNDLNDATRIPGLDLLRAVAILLVFCWHYGGKGNESWFSWLIPYGWTGVDLFFVLSGFLIASQLFKPLQSGDLPSLKTFYIKRSFRIWPAYLVVVGIYFLVPSWNEGHGLAPLWKFLTFTLNFGLDRSQASGFSHAWSLCVEEHFYLLLPALVFFVDRTKTRIPPKFFAFALPITALCTGIVLRALLWLNFVAPALADPSFKNTQNLFDKVIYYPSYNRLDGLLIGIVIALLFTLKPTFKKRVEATPNLPAILGLVFVALACWIVSDRTSFAAAVFGFPVLSLGFGGLVMSAAIPHSALNRIRVPGAALIATLSYTFYLIHKELIHLFQPILRKLSLFQDETATAVAVFVISILGALLLHIAIERPFLILRNRVLKKAGSPASIITC